MTRRRLMICMFLFPDHDFSGYYFARFLVDDNDQVHNLPLIIGNQVQDKGVCAKSCGTKCDKPHESFSLQASKLKAASHRVFRAREAAAYHGATFKDSQIPSRRTLARLALALNGNGTREGRAWCWLDENNVGSVGACWQLVSWQGRVGMTAAVRYAREGGCLLVPGLMRLCAVRIPPQQVRARQLRRRQAQGDC
jgi:hypothetical protein